MYTVSTSDLSKHPDFHSPKLSMREGIRDLMMLWDHHTGSGIFPPGPVDSMFSVKESRIRITTLRKTINCI